MFSLCGVHLLGDRFVGVLVADSVEVLAVELGESDPVRLVGDDEIEDGPHEGEAAVLAGEPADHLGAAFDLAQRALEQGWCFASGGGAGVGSVGAR